jgi:cytochrome P450 family 628
VICLADWAQGYDIGQPMTTLHQMRDRALHDKRRRHGWDMAFTTKSLRAYDARVLKYTDQLLQQLRTRSGEVVNGTKWFKYFAFDIMGMVCLSSLIRTSPPTLMVYSS